LWSDIKTILCWIGACILLKSYACPNPANTAFLVGATVRGAKQSNGARRGNVYKFLERHHGFFSKEEGIQIMYEGDNLMVKENGDACNFQTALNEWEIHKELLLVNLRGRVEIEPITPAQVPKPSDLLVTYLSPRLSSRGIRASMSDVGSAPFLPSVGSSHRTGGAKRITNSLLSKFDKLVPHLGHYKFHLKDKAKFQKLQNNENNMVAASWTFHQLMDGLNTTEGIPLVALSVKAAALSLSSYCFSAYLCLNLESLESKCITIC